MIVIIDYGMGNLLSVYKAFERLRVEVLISSSKKDISIADKLILPGVGHFATGMDKLIEYGLLDILNLKVKVEKTPILGICLGMQLLGNRSEEGNAKGLGWVSANTIRFNSKNKKKFKVPHIGWNSISKKKESLLLTGINSTESFYFVHSYYMVCNNMSDILAISDYETEFTSAVQHENIYGTQFHPEKSHSPGLQILKNFALEI